MSCMVIRYVYTNYLTSNDHDKRTGLVNRFVVMIELIRRVQITI